MEHPEHPMAEDFNTRDTIQRIFSRLDGLVEDMAHVREQTAAIVIRLDKLNGSVAKHEENIQVLKNDLVVHETTCPLGHRLEETVAEMGKALAAKEAEEKADNKWENRIHPLINMGVSIVLMIICLIALTHAKEILTLFGK